MSNVKLTEIKRIQGKIDESLMVLTGFIANPEHRKESVAVAQKFYDILSEIQDAIPKIIEEARTSS